MWKVLRLLLVLAILLFPATPVLAGTAIEISVFAKGLVSGGITNFTITYVTETHLHFDWAYTGNYTQIMIRGKYGAYPANIADNLTTPSDGYLVYTGNATSTDDTSMDFDQNPGAIYYRAWAWSPSAGWSTTPEQGWKESEIMTLLAFVALAGILTFLAIRSTYFPLKFLAGLSWWGFALYWLNNRPSAITAGSAEDTFVLILLFFVGVAVMLSAFWYTKNDNGMEIGRGFRLPFMKTPEQREEEERASYRATRRERNTAYLQKVNGALYAKRSPRR